MEDELIFEVMKSVYKVKSLGAEQLTEVLSLVWEVFCRFEAPEYSEEGVAEFRNFLNNEEEIGKLDFYGAFDKVSDIVGVLDFEPTDD